MTKLKNKKHSLSKKNKASVISSFFSNVFLPKEERAQAKPFFPEGFLPKEERAQAKPFFPEGFLPKEERAQAEAVFRLMIDSVIGLAILLIIISALNYFQGQVVIQSKADFFSLVRNAVNTPNGVVLKSGELTFTNGFTVDVMDLENEVNLSENCFELRARGGSINASLDGKKVVFNQNLKVIVYVMCVNNFGCKPYIEPDSYSSCCTQCTVSFGSPLESNEYFE
ncbi:MAG: hypothetical protein ACOX1V_02625 [Candidatus Iainarchaeum sp.]